MNITVELKEDNLVLNGVKLGYYNQEELKELVKDMDYVAHHKHDLPQKYKDHYEISIRDINMGVWEVSQIRQLIEQVELHC